MFLDIHSPIRKYVLVCFADATYWRSWVTIFSKIYSLYTCCLLDVEVSDLLKSAGVSDSWLRTSTFGFWAARSLHLPTNLPPLPILYTIPRVAIVIRLVLIFGVWISHWSDTNATNKIYESPEGTASSVSIDSIATEARREVACRSPTQCHWTRLILFLTY